MHRIALNLLTVAIATLLMTIPSSPVKSEELGVRTESVRPDLADLIIRFSWRNLPKTESACDGFDYFPEGGMRSFACHLFDLIPYADFQRLVGTRIYVKGPHTGEALTLNSENSFGYYNKEFVLKINRMLIPAISDPLFRERSQKIYDGHIQNLARIFFVTYRKWKSNPEALKKERSIFVSHLVHRDLPESYYEKFYYFMNPGFTVEDGENEMADDDGGWDGNVVKTAAAFWIRRFTDGTAETFSEGLMNLMNAYDGDFIRDYGKE
jgi:hypothetical protein